MKLIIGLGNPGELHRNNRHNTGHMVVDRLNQKKLKIKGATIVKSSTFMNDSGTAVKEILDRNRLTNEDLYIVHDDLDLPLGTWKIQYAKGPKDNGGINSIEQVLGTNNFWRIRVGIDNRDTEKRTSGEEYVLGDFTDEEKIILDKVIEEICSKLATF